MPTDPSPSPSPSPQPADWRTHLTPELQADPIVKGWSEKATEKDIPSLIKTVAHGQHRLGSAINLPGKDAKPEDVAALRTKLYESGVLVAPPADPSGYGLKKIDGLPEGLQWSDELAGKFGTVLHKHGVSKAALDELLPLYLEAMSGGVKSLTVDRDKAMATLQQEHGEKFEERKEAVRRIADGIFRTPEELQFFNATGLADHPLFMSVMMRLAPLAMADSSFMESLPTAPGGEMTAEQARAEYAKVLGDKEHKHHAGYNRQPQDPAAVRYVQDIYRRAYPQQAATA